MGSSASFLTSRLLTPFEQRPISGNMRRFLYAAGVLVFACFSPVFADSLVKTNGQKLDG